MKIEECIGRRDINAVKLARLADYHPLYVQRVLSGRMKPGRKFLKAIANLDVQQVNRYEDSSKKVDQEHPLNDS